ncbi:MAG: YlbF family regulator [Oscillospiraceae bacterium]|nr:YlbF family regulator [Oscillospiraceae bacterium]
MDIIELTRQLGVAIQGEESYKKFDEAKKANDADEALQNQIGEFNLVRMSLDKELSSENKNDDKVTELNESLRDIYSKIMMSPSMVAYNEAKSGLDEMVNKVNGIITLSINGEDPMTAELPSACTGSCGSCGGCH